MGLRRSWLRASSAQTRAVFGEEQRQRQRQSRHREIEEGTNEGRERSAGDGVGVGTCGCRVRQVRVERRTVLSLRRILRRVTWTLIAALKQLVCVHGPVFSIHLGKEAGAFVPRQRPYFTLRDLFWIECCLLLPARKQCDHVHRRGFLSAAASSRRQSARDEAYSHNYFRLHQQQVSPS